MMDKGRERDVERTIAESYQREREREREIWREREIAMRSLPEQMCQGQGYTTLGPKLYIFRVLSPRICFCFVNPYLLAGIATFFEILLLAVSKHVLKRS